MPDIRPQIRAKTPFIYKPSQSVIRETRYACNTALLLLGLVFLLGLVAISTNFRMKPVEAAVIPAFIAANCNPQCLGCDYPVYPCNQ